MKKLLKGVFMLSGVSVIAVGAAVAYFSDTETSVGNTFIAGDLDLKVDNDSWYYGMEGLVHRGDLSWDMDDLEYEPGVYHLFFNYGTPNDEYGDLKPGDWGEDTISLHTTNDSWLCVDVDLTANDDVTCTDSELEDDTLCEEPGDSTGELADQLNFLFWWDDGDNVYETNEIMLTEGPASSVLNGVTWPLADMNSLAIRYDAQGVPILDRSLDPDYTYYVGKFWCYGSATPQPLEQGMYDSVSDAVAGTATDITPGHAGVMCDGSQVDNASQTDMVMGDVTFYAEQSRHNDQFVCGTQE